MSHTLRSPASSEVLSRVMVAASAWRFFRHGAGMLSGAASILCLPGLLYGLIWMLDPETAHHLWDNQGVFESVFRSGLWIVLPLFLLTETMHIRPLFALPLTNRQIVNWQLLWGVVAIVGLHLCAVLFYRMAFGATVPFWTPLLFMCPAVVAAAGIAAVLTDFRWWRPFLIVGFLFGIAATIVNRPSRSSGPSAINTESAWLTPTWAELGGILILAAAGYGLALWGVAKARCGELRDWPDFDSLLQRSAASIGRLASAPVSARPYRSSVSAQFWYEFWEKGLILPLLVSVFGGVSLIPAYHEPHEWLSGMVVGLQLLLPLCMFGAGLFFGIIRIGNKGNGIREYRATRPLTDAQLAYAVLKGALASVLATAVIGGVLTLVVYLWWEPLAPNPVIVGVPKDSYLAFLIVGWCLLGLAASILMTGRTWVLAVPLCMGISAMLGGPLLNRLPLSPQQLEACLRLLGGAFLGTLLVGTIAAYALSIHRRIISAGTAFAGGLLWIAAAAWCYSSWPPSSPQAMSPWVLVSLTSLAAAPLATAPLALSWNRHR